MKTIERSFVWNDFGVLKSYREDEQNLFIINEHDKEMKISKKMYRSSIPLVKDKISVMTDKKIRVRTSQTTKEWCDSTWFSDIEIDTSNEAVKSSEQKPQTDSLQNIFNAATSEERQKIDLMAERLNARLRIGLIVEVIVSNGHPLKMLALRLGIDHEARGRLKIEIKKHHSKNLWWIDLPQYGIQNIMAALAFEKENYYLISIEPENPELFRNAIMHVFNKREADIKNDARLRVEQLLDIHKKVKAAMKSELSIH
jgi:hypothetical protein